MGNRVILFTEAGTLYGYGHLTRCMALYDELVCRDVRVELVVDSDVDLADFLGKRSHFVDKWQKKLHLYPVEGCFLIVDSYHVTEEDCDTISNRSAKVLFIDDTCRISYPKGFVANPNIGAELISYQKKDGQRLLMGPEYVILRREFQEASQGNFLIKIADNVDDILILLGGADVAGIAPMLLSHLSKPSYGHIRKHLVVGAGFQEKEFLQVLAVEQSSISLYNNLKASELIALMRDCDLAITAAGQTIYELMAVGLPFICLKVVDNQENNIKGLLEYDIIEDFFDCTSFDRQLLGYKALLEEADKQRNDFEKWLDRTVGRMMRPHLRLKQVEAMKKLQIGSGTNRIIDNFIGEKH